MANNNANYLAQLNLQHPPFADTSDEAFFYADPERSKYLDMLQHLLQYSDEILVLSGEAGSGKSLLLEKLAARADEQWLVCHIVCSEPTGGDSLFAQIAACLNLQAEGDAAGMLDALCNQLNELQQHHFPVLLIDDAQNLSDDALEMTLHLAGLDGANGKLLHLVMAGDRVLNERLGDKRYSSLPPPHRLELDGLGEAHSAAYLMRRLQAAGHEGDSPFSVAELKQLHKESNGIPGQLNVVANKLLNSKYGKRPLSMGVRRILQGGLAAMALIGTVLGLQDRIGVLLDDDEEMPAVMQQVVADPVSETMSQPVHEPSVAEPETPFESEVGLAKTPAKKQLALKHAAEADTPPMLVVKNDTQPREKTTVADNTATKFPLPGEAPAELKLMGTDPEKVNTDSGPVELILRGAGFRPGSKVALSHAGKVVVLQQDLVEFINGSKLAITITPGMKPSDWAVQVSTPDNRRSNVLHFAVIEPPVEEKENTPQMAEAVPAVNESKPQLAEALPVAKPKPVSKPKPVAKPKPSSKRATSARNAEWYRAQPTGHYTLQLMASQSRTNITAYIKQNRLPEPLARFSMQRNGRTLYVLTYGSFADKSTALKAVANLPGGVKPWARPIDNIKQVMLQEATSTKNRVSSDTSPDTAWIWSQDPTRYTIQLAAGGSEAAVLEVKQQVSLPDELAVAKALRNGKPWFVLVYGSFPSKASARDTISRLPSKLRQSGPWARSFSSLQDELSRSTPSQ
jgi:septal ring-binding cell division protein DamX/type II secretory pathway predicted ATPase ExeA